MRDPYQEEIRERLAAPGLDGDTFEACAADLLREVFPGLVPIRGGSDAGMDGAIADGEGRAFPLVCTTAKRVLSNLRRSLESYLHENGPRRQAVLATSQALTPRRRRNLEVAAEKRGFTLLQIIEREGMADRLYHSPRWCKELLGLTARPSALASIPDSRRPLFDIDLIGRDKDIKWLQRSTGDRIVAGEPGSGKTFLLYKYAQEVGALFLVDDDREAVASALLEQEPSIVIVDDAHVHLDRIDLLRRLRRQGREFSILAATWRGDADSVSEALGTVPESRIRRLELLTRNELVEVYRQAGTEERDVGPDVLRELVTQASNKPGLAVTIATLWHQGAWQEVLRGEALKKNLVPQLERLVGPEAISILASFGLGGDTGLEMVRVGRFLGLSLADVQRKTALLAAGGVLAERPENRLAVQPPVLRSALLRKVFFSGQGTDLPWREMVAEPEEDKWSYRSSVEAIVQAAHVGAEIPRQELKDLVKNSGKDDIWREFAYLDEAAAEWVLATFPGDLERIASSTLHHAPNTTVTKLLRKAEADDEQAAGGRSRPLEMLSSWLQETFQAGEPLRRRRVVIQEARRFLAASGAKSIGYQALISAMSLRLSTSHRDPGKGATVTFTQGILSRQHLDEMRGLWQEIHPALTDSEAVPWSYLGQVFWDWIHPQSMALGKISDEHISAIHTLFHEILSDLAPLAEGKPWITALLVEWAEKVELRLDLPRSEEFDLLYPASSEKLRTERDEALKGKVAELAELPPDEVARKLATLRKGAEAIGRGAGQSAELHFSRFLADVVKEPEEWLQSFVEADLPQSFLRPLLEGVVQARRPGWAGWLRHFLREERLRWIGLPEILALPEPPEDLLKAALAVADSWTRAVEQVCLTREASFPVLRALLTHPSWEVAMTAAVGEWHSGKSQCRTEIAPEWRAAVLRSATESLDQRSDHSLLDWLQQVLAKDPELAQSWIQDHLSSPESGRSLEATQVLNSAVKALSLEQRKVLMTWWASLKPREAPRRFLWVMVDRSPILYRHLLQQNLDRRWLLEPLAGKPDEKWPGLVEAALEAGFDSREIAAATLPGEYILADSGIAYWTQWDQAFAAFEDHTHEAVRITVQEGRRLMQARIDEAHEEERQTELYGLG